MRKVRGFIFTIAIAAVFSSVADAKCFGKKHRRPVAACVQGTQSYGLTPTYVYQAAEPTYNTPGILAPSTQAPATAPVTPTKVTPFAQSPY